MFFLYANKLDEKDDGLLKCCCTAVEPDDKDDTAHSGRSVGICS